MTHCIMRMTRQRQIILEELRKVKTHPTADEVYDIVRRRISHISLSTVYRNLEILSSNGVILKLELGGAQRRYDGDPSGHYHIRCVYCGRVDDVPVLPVYRLDDMLRRVSNYEVLGHQLEFVGVCPQCQRERGDYGA